MLPIIWNRFLKIKLVKQSLLGWFLKRWMSQLVLLIILLKRVGLIAYHGMMAHHGIDSLRNHVGHMIWPRLRFSNILNKDWTILHYFISFGSAKDVSNLLCRDDFQPCLKTGSFLPLLFLPECPESAQKKSLIKKFLLKKNFDIRKVTYALGAIVQPPTQSHAKK